MTSSTLVQVGACHDPLQARYGFGADYTITLVLFLAPEIKHDQLNIGASRCLS